MASPNLQTWKTQHTTISVKTHLSSASNPQGCVRRIKAHAYPSLRSLPLYAYLPHRGTTECLLRAPQGLFGGLQVSLDMEKAFDSVRRDIVLLALRTIALPPDFLSIIETWLAPHPYYILYKTLVGNITATRGIKQGSTDAPMLWSLCTHLILFDLLHRYSHTWLHDHAIIYADDVHLTSVADGHTALSDLSHILHTFNAYGFRINAAKSFVLFRAWKGVAQFTRRWIPRTKHGPQLMIPGLPYRLPIVAKTAYLGVIIGYRAWESDATNRRIRAAQLCFTTLKRWLQARTIPQSIRFRLYAQCVAPTVQYGIHEMGMTHQCCKRIVSMISVHYRRMTRSHVHLTARPWQIPHSPIQMFARRS